jgi:amino acid transporter
MQFFTIKCSYINFVPTIISLIVAIIAICSGKGQLISEINNNSNNFNILNSLSAFPAVFFAYTGYMIIGSLVNKMDNPEKNIKLAIVYSSLVILIIYILTTLALLILPDENGNYGNVCYIFDTIIDKKYQ